MNSPIINITKDEWRYWLRSKLGLRVIIMTNLLVIVSSIITLLSVNEATEERQALQHTSESIFLEQPDRHPHRMVHYGHYVFRTPSPLSIIDPGVDAYTGTSIFLEGHRQNSATFSTQQQSSGLTRFGNLTPSFVLQILLPLLLILIGFSSVSREKENQTLSFILSQGVTPSQIILGKFLAVLLIGLLALIPLIIAGTAAVLVGEEFTVAVSFLFVHGIYILIWSAIVVLASAIATKNNISFVLLIALWVVLCILVPRISTSTASSLIVSVGKLESDFEVIAEMRKLGDGHNATDKAFEQLKLKILDKYKVNKVEELPINFKGTVAQYSESQQAKVLAKFAEKRMEKELKQAMIARQFGWLSPVIALRTASMSLAGTNLETHHRFLRQAEELRLDFVQGLNKIHEEKLSYHDDENRRESREAAERAKVSASNWTILKKFNFRPASGFNRIKNTFIPFLQLLLSVISLAAGINLAKRRLQ